MAIEEVIKLLTNSSASRLCDVDTVRLTGEAGKASVNCTTVEGLIKRER